MNRVSQSTVFKKGFKEAYQLIPEEQQSTFIKNIQSLTGWSIATFYNRLKGSKPVKISEKNILIQCFQEYDIDLNTVIAEDNG